MYTNCQAIKQSIVLGHTHPELNKQYSVIKSDLIKFNSSETMKTQFQEHQTAPIPLTNQSPKIYNLEMLFGT